MEHLSCPCIGPRIGAYNTVLPKIEDVENESEVEAEDKVEDADDMELKKNLELTMMLR